MGKRQDSTYSGGFWLIGASGIRTTIRPCGSAWLTMVQTAQEIFVASAARRSEP